MSRERARRRAAREHEAALRRAARAAEQERRERRAARRRRLHGVGGRVRLGTRSPVGRATGARAQRRRRQTAALLAVVVALNVVLWVVRPDWEARLGGLVVSVLAFPVLRLLVLDRR